MIVTINYDMDGDNDDSLNLDYALNGWKMSIILWDLDQHLRGLSKYGNDADRNIDVDTMREKIREIMSDYGLTFEDRMFN